jgi:murein L,D-transpeptidase YcbB/YkuD
MYLDRVLLCLSFLPLFGCGAAISGKSKSYQNQISLTEQTGPDTETYSPYNRAAGLRSFLRGLQDQNNPPTLIQTLQANLDRWDQLGDLEDRYLEVNIPSFTLSVYEGPTILKSYRVIVGKPSDPTPILRGEVSYMELNPYWEVPHQIAAKEILPELKKNSSYLLKNHMELFTLEGEKIDPDSINWKKIGANNFRFHIHQIPGPWNAVGKIKFAFPNQYSVYLHGTPNQSLFEKDSRTFSHGCIRIEDPLSLAIFLLKDTDWTEDKIQAAIDTGKTRRIVLKTPMPIYLNYWTVSVDADGSVEYAPDVYQLDSN